METLIMNSENEKIFKLYADDGSGLVQDLNLAYAYLNLIEQNFQESGDALVIGDNYDQDLLQMYEPEQLNVVLSKIPAAEINFRDNPHTLLMLKNLKEIIEKLLVQ
ncbi:MAG: hypothetical protein HUN04_22905 [Desulfobacter sp.]|nr:MAG: hypothetical protein HUN04_22905 [Desulfobacter sp.]